MRRLAKYWLKRFLTAKDQPRSSSLKLLALLCPKRHFGHLEIACACPTADRDASRGAGKQTLAFEERFGLVLAFFWQFGLSTDAVFDGVDVGIVFAWVILVAIGL